MMTRVSKGKGQERPSHDRIVVITGVAGVIVVAISTCITAYQAIVMRRELNNTLDQQRAWIKLDAAPEIFVTSADGALLTVRIKATNVGSVPALGVEAGAALWSAPGPKAMSKKPLHRDEPNCPKPSSIGTVIFPGETVELLARNPRTPASELKYLADAENHVQIMTAICAIYRSGARSELRRTVASFAITKGGPGADDSKLDASREGIIPPNLQLIRMGVGDKAE